MKQSIAFGIEKISTHGIVKAKKDNSKVNKVTCQN